jgi:hypothetical protein
MDLKETYMAKNSNQDITLYAVGDIGPERQDPVTIFSHVADTIRQGDINFAQLEVNLSTRGSGRMKENARDPRIAGAMKEAGFNVISFASNHSLDAGVDAFLDTLDNLKKEGLPVIGAGRNIAEARRPAFFDIKGTRVAWLGYNSVLKENYWADENRPGCAPLRAYTLYEQIVPSQPGTPARVHSFPYRNDLAAMQEDVRKAKKQADVVVVSMHCGVHMTPALIAEYQKDIAHAAVDAGADLVLHHHAHILKGIEVYAGKVIFYSLCNFALELRIFTKEKAADPHFIEESRSLTPDWHPPYPDYPAFPFPPDSRKTLIAKAVISGGKIKKVSFLPTIINTRAEPEILKADDKRFKQIVKYMKDISKDQGLTTPYAVEGDEVVVRI